MLSLLQLLFFAAFTILPADEIHPAKKWEARAYLATYPRSGNHWMRYLIEEATHIATSSVYRDIEYRLTTNFPWGGYCSKNGYEGTCRYPVDGERFVIKTHYPALKANEFDNLPYQVVIHIVRNPISAIYSYFKYHYSVSYVKKIPSEWVVKNTMLWKVFEEYWKKQPNVLTIRYEDLLANPELVLTKVLKTLGYTFTEEDVKRAVSKYPPQEKSINLTSLYHKKDLAYLKSTLKGLLQLYGY